MGTQIINISGLDVVSYREDMIRVAIRNNGRDLGSHMMSCPHPEFDLDIRGILMLGSLKPLRKRRILHEWPEYILENGNEPKEEE